MISVEYMVSYSQVLEILKHIPKEDYDKVPKDMIELFERNKYKNSEFKYNPNKTLQEQNTTKITRIIIAMLFRDYWATNAQKEEILKIQEEQRKNYVDVNDMFKRKKERNQNEELTENEEKIGNQNLPQVIEKDSIFEKIKSFFKNILKK